jgi:hypothetical protein
MTKAIEELIEEESNVVETPLLADWLKVFQSDNLPPITVGYGENKISFYTRIITDEEEETVLKRIRELIDFDDETQRKRLFAIYKEAIGKFSVSNPLITLGEQTQILPGKTPAEAIEKLFPKYEAKSWKIIRRVWNEFRVANEPDVNFK